MFSFITFLCFLFAFVFLIVTIIWRRGGRQSYLPGVWRFSQQNVDNFHRLVSKKTLKICYAKAKKTPKIPKISLGFNCDFFRIKRKKKNLSLPHISRFYHLKITEIEEKIIKMKHLYHGLIFSMRLNRKGIQSAKISLVSFTCRA